MYLVHSRAATKKWKRKIKKGTFNNIKSLVKTTKGQELVEDENRNKEQGQQIENSNKFGKYYFSYIVITCSINV
jgi:hypothetical protein